MLVGNVLLDKGGGLEQLLARFASEATFVFLFDEWLDCFRKLTFWDMNRRDVLDNERLLVVTLASVVSGVNAVFVDKESNLCIEPLQPTLICKNWTVSHEYESLATAYHFSSSPCFQWVSLLRFQSLSRLPFLFFLSQPSPFQLL